MITIVGAGSIGLSLGARLAASGVEVVFVTRRVEAAAALNRGGIQVTDPASGARFTAPARAVTSATELPSPALDGPFIVCVRTTDTPAIATELNHACPQAWIVSAQNDVHNEALFAAHGHRTSGLVMRQTCTVQAPGEVFALGPGRVVLGDHPDGVSDDCAALARDLEGAGFDVGRSHHIGRDKWLKLCVNLMSTPNALVRRDEHATHAFVECKARLLEEARAVLGAAGILAESCDGRDRSLDAEIAYQRASLAGGTSVRPLPIYNAVWRALREPELGLEADAFHGRFIELGEAHDVATPVNRAARALLEAARTGQTGPESIGADAFLA